MTSGLQPFGGGADEALYSVCDLRGIIRGNRGHNLAPAYYVTGCLAFRIPARLQAHLRLQHRVGTTFATYSVIGVFFL
jgi:hypothetical protein